MLGRRRPSVGRAARRGAATGAPPWWRWAAARSGISRASSPPPTCAGSNFVQVPTTLLAQVDASIGGKTAIDHPARQEPDRRLPSAAARARGPGRAPDTLPEREFRSGLAEVIKHGIVLDAAYFADLERDARGLCSREIADAGAGGRGLVPAQGPGRGARRAGSRAARGAELRPHDRARARGGHRASCAGRTARRCRSGSPPRRGWPSVSAWPPRATRRGRWPARSGGPARRGLGAAPAAVVEALGRDKKSRDGRVPFVLAPEIGSLRARLRRASRRRSSPP